MIPNSIFQQKTNIFRSSLMLLLWILVRPTAWHDYISKIDSSLSSSFCLIELNDQQWRNPLLLRLLIQVNCILPLIISSLSLFSFLILGFPLIHIMAAFLNIFGYSLGYAIAGSLFCSVAFGIIGSSVGGATYLILNSMVDGGEAQVAYILISTIAGGFFYSLISSKNYLSITKKAKFSCISAIAGGIFISLIYITARILSLLLVSAVIITSSHILAFNGNNDIIRYIGEALPENLALMIVGFSIFSVATKLTTPRWRKNLKIILLISAVGGLGSLPALGIPYIDSEILFSSPFILSVSLLSSLHRGLASVAIFTAPYMIAKRMINPKIGAISGLLLSTIYWAYYYGAFSITHILIGCLAVYSSLTISVWAPILLYPLLLIWNTFLYYADQKSPKKSFSFFKYHSAFWDDLQQLPLLGLDKHILLIANKYPHIAEEAIKYLSNGHQRWAAQSAQSFLNERQTLKVNKIP